MSEFTAITRLDLPARWFRLFPGKPEHDDSALGWEAALLGLVAAFLFFFQLHQPLLDPDEGRQAEVPREMLDRGDWLVPHWRGKPYYEKPPLQYWLTATLYLLLGVAPASARLVPATAAWATVMLTYLWGRRVLTPRASLLSALILCLMPGFFVLGRTVMLDSLLTLAVVAGWFTGYLALRSAGLHKLWWPLCALICGLGILQKGPVILVLVLVPLTLFSRLNIGAAKIGWRAMSVFMLLAAAVALPWYAAMAVREPGYLEAYLWRAHVIRFARPFDHEQPWWFYGPVLLAGIFPWSLLFPALTLFLLSRRGELSDRRPAGLGLAFLAFVWCVFFYSLSGCKSPPYLMPALPPLALLLGALLHTILSQEFVDVGLLRWARKTMPMLTSLAMLLLAPLAYCLPRVFLDSSNRLLSVGVALTVLLLFVWWRWVRQADAAVAWGFLGLVMFLGLVLPVRETVWAFAARRSPESIAAVAQPLMYMNPQVVLFDRDWYSVHFYLRRQKLPHFDWRTRERLLEFVGQSLERQPGSLVMVLVDSGAKTENFVKLLPATLDVKVFRPPFSDQPTLVLLRRAADSGAKGRAGAPLPFSQGPL